MGCGWLGFPLAISLIKDGYAVNGSTTSKEKIPTLKKKGISPFLISLGEQTILGAIDDFLKGLDVLIINVPPKLRKSNTESYIGKIQVLHKALKQVKPPKILFISSTSVYGEINGIVTEETHSKPTTESGKQLLATENLFLNDSELQTTIIRFGGLIGQNRHPIEQLSGKKGLTNGNSYVNLIHLEDCITIIKTILENRCWGEIFNGVYPYHPFKKEYYKKQALLRNLTPPSYAETTLLGGKRISSEKIINKLNYQFKCSIES